MKKNEEWTMLEIIFTVLIVIFTAIGVIRTVVDICYWAHDAFKASVIQIIREDENRYSDKDYTSGIYVIDDSVYLPRKKTRSLFLYNSVVNN